MIFTIVRRFSSSAKKFPSMANFRPVSHVIFDMDGLLLDTEKIYESTMGSVVRGCGKEYLKEVRLAILGRKEQDAANIIVQRLNLPISSEEFCKRAKDEQSKLMGDARLMPGAERLLRHLHSSGIPIAVATSSGSESVKLKTSKHQELFKLFHHIVKGSSDPEVVNGKPAPDIFLVAAKRFPSPPQPEKCLVFEDAPNGVKAARSASMQVVMVPEAYIPDELKTEATLVIKSLLDFKPELFGLPPFTD